MTLAVLRRRTRTESIPITSTPPAAPVVEDVEPPTVPLQPDRPPTYTPGLCWHKVHVYIDGERYGVSPIRTSSSLYQMAAITPCGHLSRTGR